MDILTYLESNQILVGEEEFKKRHLFKDIEDMKHQIDLILLVQKLMMKQKNTIIPRINSVIGKEIEEYKVQLRKINRNINNLKERRNKSKLDEYFIDQSNKILKVAEKSLDLINEKDYHKLIKRSMENYEICLGRVDENNLQLNNEGIIVIRTTRYFSYNLIEHDMINYIKRLKRRGNKELINELTLYFIDEAQLGKSSIQYIQALNSYPMESMRILSKYLININNDIEKDWEGEINWAVKIDANELW